MFGLIRRFSGSVIPRPDRPWAEDPTSNAPRVGHKRRMADEDRDEDDEEQARQKKVRGATDEALPDARESSSTPLPHAPETAGVKEVTQGVKEVDLETKSQAVPESVPLPEEKAGELDGDDASSTASTPPPTGEPSEAQETDAVAVSETAPAPEAASGEIVSDPAVADPKEPTQALADAPDSDAIAADPVSAPAPTSPRPIKKLRAKPKSTAEPAASAET
ncbi:hypothetical protein C8F04DRAFT_1041368 [Mycena alexandri]|uniref:Uncharacterized protein n=1 Tax=Mycena alexandri TaxID=1745969 RepID=A0AAD6SPH8_9AGAR|nr:hypothetical protein C8F04DRAFT_1041368 [Mycena alexandri]